MIKVGLTGGIASGKNFIAGLFKEKGCHILDADEVSRKVMQADSSAYPHIVKAFGRGILAPSGEIDRAVLRKTVVDNPEKLKMLESIVHPAVLKYSGKWMKEVRNRDNNAIAIHHAPLLLEAGGAATHDVIIVIWCSLETQKERLKLRKSPPYEEALKLLAVQTPFEEKAKYAHHIINNDGTKNDARKEVDRVYSLLRMIEYGNKHIK